MIQKVREWAILLSGIGLMVFCVYAFYFGLEIDNMILIGGIILGILLIAQPGRLNELFDTVFQKIKGKPSVKSNSTVDPTVDPPKDGGDPPKL